MKAIILMEESGVVRDSFIECGYDAISVDLEPSRSDKGPHIQDDVFSLTDEFLSQFDFFGVHPVCDFLTVSGNGSYAKGKPGYHKRLEAIQVTEALWNRLRSLIPYGYLENPKGVLSTQTKMGRPKYVHPWQHGHGETKETGLWLHNLPPLQPTNIVEGREQRVWKMAPGPNRKRDRSETYKGIGMAIASQYGKYVSERIKNGK